MLVVLDVTYRMYDCKAFGMRTLKTLTLEALNCKSREVVEEGHTTRVVYEYKSALVEQMRSLA